MSYVDDVLAKVIAKNPSEPEFHQAVTEVFETIRPLIEANEEEYKKQAVLGIIQTAVYSRSPCCPP